MPEVNTQTVHDVALTQGDLDRLEDGAAFEIELSDGSTLKLTGPGDGSASGSSVDTTEIVETVEDGASAETVAEGRDDVSEEDVKNLVQEARQEQANPSMIDKNPDQPDDVEQV
jgi:uncharacterized protein (DUF433 family)